LEDKGGVRKTITKGECGRRLKPALLARKERETEEGNNEKKEHTYLHRRHPLKGGGGEEGFERGGQRESLIRGGRLTSTPAENLKKKRIGKRKAPEGAAGLTVD